MNETEIRDAIASQEEHIKRSRSCRGVIGVSHQWATHGNPRTGEAFEACIVCNVTKSLQDYEKRLARPASTPNTA
jgi:hypothetical protein